jgi:hypothetical protein
MNVIKLVTGWKSVKQRDVAWPVAVRLFSLGTTVDKVVSLIRREVLEAEQSKQAGWGTLINWVPNSQALAVVRLYASELSAASGFFLFRRFR